MTGIAERRAAGVPDAEVRRRLVRFFAAEAQSRSERLAAALAGPAPPGQAQLVDATTDARLVRGSAEIADVPGVAFVAGHLERILKALHGRRLGWTPALSTALRSGSSALLDLVEATTAWDSEHDELARRAVTELSRYDVTQPRRRDETVVPIGRLFHSDSGPHILFVPVTPQTEFEQQLRALAARGAPGGVLRTPPGAGQRSTRTPTAPRGQELRTLLSESVSRMKASFGGSTEPPVPIEQLLYSGTAALERARELARTIRARGPENARELIPELIDLLDLAAPG